MREEKSMKISAKEDREKRSKRANLKVTRRDNENGKGSGKGSSRMWKRNTVGEYES